MVTTSQTPPKPFTLMIGDDPVYSLDTDRRRIGFGTRQPQRRVHIVTPDEAVLRVESAESATASLELTGSGGTGTISYNSAADQLETGGGYRVLSSQEFDVDPTKPRVVHNTLSRDGMIVDAFSAFTSGDGSLADADDKMSFAATTGGAGGRAWYSESFTAEAGQAYCLSFRVAGLTGTQTNDSVYLADGPDSGDRSAAATADGRWCIRFSFSSETATSFRLGLGCQSDENGAVSATFSEWMLEEVDSVADGPSEYTPPGLPSAFGYANGNSVSGGAVTEEAGDAIDYRRPRTALLVGDSFSDEHNDIPFLVANTHPDWVVVGASQGGRTLDAGAGLVAGAMLRQQVGQRIASTTYYPTFSDGVVSDRYVIAMLAVNDVVGDATLTQMQVRASAFAEAAWGVDPSVTVVFASCPPFGNSSSYTVGREAVRSAYNAWLRTFVKSNSRLRLFDANALLRDPADTKDLIAAYDSGDGLHPNATGTAALAAALGRELERIQSLAIDIMHDGVVGASLTVDPATGDVEIRKEDGAGAYGGTAIRIGGRGTAGRIGWEPGNARLYVDGGNFGIGTQNAQTAAHVYAAATNGVLRAESGTRFAVVSIKDSVGTVNLTWDGQDADLTIDKDVVMSAGLGVPVVADGAAQGGLTASPGRLSFRQSDSKLCVYNGSSWVAVH